MAKYTIDGLTYTEGLPHSRAERTLIKILNKDGGDHESDDDHNENDDDDSGNG